MDSSTFHSLIVNFTTLEDSELSDVRNLCLEHPYSQILHVVQARAAHDLKQKDESQLLHQSAVYATDRSVLKSVMTAPKRERLKPVAKEVAPFVAAVADEITREPVEEIVPLVTEQQPEAPQITAREASAPGLTGDALRSDLLAELKKLKKLKHDFEHSVEVFEKQSHPPFVESVSGDKSALAEVASADKPASADTASADKHEEEPKKKRGRPKGSAPETLLEEIQTTKKELPLESPRQKEQNEIIDQFIKEKPIILKPKAGEPAKDLSEDSGAFSDNIISETLVGILLKQGKKDKAIEVLRKLIWKFPQKKAYFAAQIDSLKN